MQSCFLSSGICGPTAEAVDPPFELAAKCDTGSFVAHDVYLRLVEGMKSIAHNKAINSDHKKRRSFLTLLFVSGYGNRYKAKEN